MKFIKFGRLVGLDGMPKSVPGWHARSRTEAIRVLRAKGVVTSASDCGSITIWKPKGGGYRAEFSRYMHRMSDVRRPTLADIESWLKKWWPKMSKW